VEAPNLDPSVRRIACPWALRTCAVHWNGDMVACAVDYDGRFVAGNLTTRTIADVWQHEHRRLRDQHFAHDFDHLPAPCQNCIDWQVAGGARHYDPETDGPGTKEERR